MVLVLDQNTVADLQNLEPDLSLQHVQVAVLGGVTMPVLHNVEHQHN